MKQIFEACSTEEAVRLIKSFSGSPLDFELKVKQAVFQSTNISAIATTGIQMALITDAVLSRKWWPDKVIDEVDFKVLSYREW